MSKSWGLKNNVFTGLNGFACATKYMNHLQRYFEIIGPHYDKNFKLKMYSTHEVKLLNKIVSYEMSSLSVLMVDHLTHTCIQYIHTYSTYILTYTQYIHTQLYIHFRYIHTQITVDWTFIRSVILIYRFLSPKHLLLLFKPNHHNKIILSIIMFFSVTPLFNCPT